MNGETEKSQFRSWWGSDVNDLLNVRNAEMVTVHHIEEDCYKIKPRLVVIDSAQMLAGWGRGKGVIEILSKLRYLKTQEAAGNPHIILISQLNKKKEYAYGITINTAMMKNNRILEARNPLAIIASPQKINSLELTRCVRFQFSSLDSVHGIRMPAL